MTEPKTKDAKLGEDDLVITTRGLLIALIAVAGLWGSADIFLRVRSNLIAGCPRSPEHPDCAPGLLTTVFMPPSQPHLGGWSDRAFKDMLDQVSR